jgi:hypothetical protein
LPFVRRALALASIAGCLILGACGGDDADEPATTTTAEPPATTTPASEAPDAGGGEGDAEAAEDGAVGGVLSIPALVELVLTSDEPRAVCEPPNVTEAFLRTGYGGRAGCVDAIESGGAIAESVNVEVDEESASAATAVAVATGGVYDGEEIELALVKDGEAWSIDRLEVDVPAGP